ncbi:MAG: hypothetical protein AB4352_11935 [Hormoscilla sp.]
MGDNIMVGGAHPTLVNVKCDRPSIRWWAVPTLPCLMWGAIAPQSGGGRCPPYAAIALNHFETILLVGFQPTLAVSRGFEPTAGQETN